MVETLSVQVRDGRQIWTRQEQKLLEVLFMRICAHLNYRCFSRAMRIRPQNVESIHVVINHQLVFEEPISERDASHFSQLLVADLEKTFAFCEMAEPEVFVSAK